MSALLPRGDRWFTELRTSRLAVGRLQPHQAAGLSSYRSDPDVAIFQDWATPFERGEAERFVASMTGVAPLVPGEWFQYAITTHDSSSLIGDVAVYRHAGEPTHLTIGYTLAKDHWGNGFATEAVGAVLDHAIALCGATRISAEALASNEPSLAVLRRLGFAEVNRIERAEEIDGVWHDEVVYHRSIDPPVPALGTVLVGGASSRMGSPKSLVEVAGRTMFEWVTAAMEEAGLEVVVSGSGPTPDHDFPVVPDRAGLSGPVAGITSVFSQAPGRPVFVAATDQPYLSAATIRRLLAMNGQVVAPVDADRIQVTSAVYRPSFLDALEGLVAEDPAPSIQSLARDVGSLVEPEMWSAWGEDGRSWRSLDTPDAVAAAIADLGEPI